MATIAGMIRKFESLDAYSIAAEAADETKDNFVSLNAEQMHKGLDSEGEKIGEYRSELYAEQKHRINPLPGFGFVDLRLTGAFYEGMYMRVEGDSLLEGSEDEKAEGLEEKYGKAIFGLSAPFSREYINEFLRPVFVRRMEDATGIKFGK
jgi:hypothetical protein